MPKGRVFDSLNAYQSQSAMAPLWVNTFSLLYLYERREGAPSHA